MPAFTELGLCPELLKAVEEQGYTEPTPIQAQAIPLVLAGRDVMGGAQTGTGKTASFVLPILQRLSRHANTSASPARHPVRALILTPTRELAVQVEESVRLYGKHIPLRATVVYGGVPMDPQTQALRRGVEILVATPGRLLDHVQQKILHFPQVEFFVLDEADRMLDMGFMPDVKRIISLLPKKRQNLLFSATFSEEIKRLADSFLQNPVMAPFLFIGLLYFWLIPGIHTRVMLDANLYELMNWTMSINGVMFWSLILDSRAKPPARLSHLMRAALILVIELPQMVLGAILSLTERDIYPVYMICGRVLDMTALNDQHYGGLIIWLPGTLTSFAAMIVVLVTMRLNEERAEREAA